MENKKKFSLFLSEASMFLWNKVNKYRQHQLMNRSLIDPNKSSFCFKDDIILPKNSSPRHPCTPAKLDILRRKFKKRIISLYLLAIYYI